MKIAVCVKQIPRADSEVTYDPPNYTVARQGALVIDDADMYGVEMALRLAEQAGGGDVTVISMAPGGHSDGLRTALAMGANRAILVSDPALAGSDALGTAKVLAAALGRAIPDLVIAATESTDGSTGTVPVQLAELLSWPSVSFVRHAEIGGQGVKVERQTEVGIDEIDCPLPAVLTVTAGVVEVRYPTFKGILSAKSKPLESLTLDDLGVDPDSVGARGARQEMVSVDKVDTDVAGEIIVDNGEAFEQIIALLQSWKIL